MLNRHLFIAVLALCIACLLQASPGSYVSAQEFPEEEEDVEDILPELPEEIFGEEEIEPFEAEVPDEERPRIDRENMEPGEEENRWTINIMATIKMNYLFNNSEDSFIVNYRWQVNGEANAATAVIRGTADIDAEVEGFLSKWPTGECRLEVSIPKVPFEITFRRTNEERSDIRLVFRGAISEAWQSKCTFADAPGARFDTIGEPEQWLTRALKKARPPLRSIIADLADEETTTTSVIGKQIISDPPLGSGEFEGIVTITVGPRYE
jgi:hypothetical protein